MNSEDNDGLNGVGRAVEARGKDIEALLRGVPQLPRPRPADGGEQKTVSVGEEAIRKMFTGLPPKRDQIFISYSHDDEEWLHKLQIALTPHIYNSAIKAWDDTHIPPGARWREEITRAIAAAKVAVLLVSMNFFASKFINDVEMQAFLRASSEEKNGLTILPVIVGPSIYEEWPLLKDIQTVNRLDRPLKGIENMAELDAELVMISKEIKKALVPREASALPNPEAATT